MASSFRRSLSEDEVQGYLGRVTPPVDLRRAQTLARSSSNPAAQQAGEQMIAQQRQETEQAARQQAQEAQRQQEQQQRDTDLRQRQIARQQEEQRARNVRAAADAGVETKTDVETGKRTIETNADGSPKYKAGPTGPVEYLGESTKPVVDQSTGQTVKPVDTGVMLGGGGDSGAVDASGATRTGVFAQPVRDDHGRDSYVEPETQTDKKSGLQVVKERSQVSGRMTERAVGVDEKAQEAARRAAVLDQETQAHQLRQNAFDQAHGQFKPNWEPVQREYKQAEAELERVNKSGVAREEINGKGVWMKTSPETGAKTMLSPDEVTFHQKRRGEAEARFGRAKAAFDKLSPQADRIEQVGQQLNQEKLRLAEERIRIASGLPQDDGGAATTLAKEELGITQTPGEAAVADHLGLAPTAPQTPTGEAAPAPAVDTPASPAQPADKPLVPTDRPDAARTFSDAFGSLVKPEELTVSRSGEGWSMIRRNGVDIGSVDIDPTGSPRVVLNDAPQNKDLRAVVAFGKTSGVPVFVKTSLNQMTKSAEARWVAGLYQAVDQVAQGGVKDDQGTITNATDLQRQLNGRLTELGASPFDLQRRVAEGEIPVQTGEALMKNLYGSTLQTTADPTNPASFQKWVTETSKRQNDDHMATYGTPSRDTVANQLAAAGNNKEARDNVMRDYWADFYAANRGKPGVTRGWIQQQMARGDSKAMSTGDKAKDLAGQAGRFIVNDAVASMAGMLTGVASDAASAEMALFGSKEAAKALKESMGMRNRDTANWVAATGRNAKVYFSDAGKKASTDLSEALHQFKAAVDDEWDKQPGQQDKARLASASSAVTKAAVAFHNLNQDDKWPVTADNVDPEKDPALKSALTNYIVTADPRYMQLFTQRLMMANGRRQLSAEIEKKTAGMGGFQRNFVGAMNVGWQELGSEMVGDALVLASAGGSKALQAAFKAAGFTGRAARVAGLATEFARMGEAVEKFGMLEESLVKPLTRGQRLRNMAVQGAKTAAESMVGEGLEEVIVEPGSDQPDPVQAFLGGAAGGVALAPAFYLAGRGLHALGERMDAGRLQAENAKFAQRYNAAFADTPGFKEITPDQAAIARTFVDSEEFRGHAEAYQQAKQQFDAARAGLADTVTPDPASEKKLANVRGQLEGVRKALGTEGLTPERQAALEARAAELQAAESELAPQEAPDPADALDRLLQARQQLDGIYASTAEQTINAVDATNEIAELEDPARQTFFRGIAKVATGNEAALTSNERAAIGGAQTNEGAAYFAEVSTAHGVRTVLTDEARAQLRAEMPALGRLVRTTESDALFEQQLGGAPVAPEAAPAGQPAVENPGGAASPVSHTPAPASPVGQASPNPAELDAAEYEAFHSATPGSADIPSVVQQAVASRRPVSVSMARAAGVDIPDGYEQSGATLVPRDIAPAPEAATEANPAAQVAQDVQQRVETAMPALRGRVEVVDALPGGGESGGVVTDSSGKIQLVLSDIQREIETHGGDVEAVADSIEQLAARHEVVHLVQFEAVRSLWEQEGRRGDFGAFFQSWYGQMAKELPAEAFAAARSIYGAEPWDAIPTDANRAAEFVRMLVEAKLDPDKADEFSELFRAVRTGSSSTLIRTLRAAVEMIVNLIKTGKLPESIQQHVAQIEDLYRELQGDSVSKAGPDEKQPDSSSIDEQQTGGSFRVEHLPDDQVAIHRGEQRLWVGPREKAVETVRSLQEAEHSPLRVTGLAIADALKRHPDLKRGARAKLEAITEELSDALKELPEDHRRPVVDAALEEWIADQSRPKEQRRIDAPAKQRAYQILNSGEHPGLTALFQSGSKIAPRPNLISLVLAKKRAGTKLSTKEIALLENNPEYDDAVFQSQYDNAGRGRVAREIIGLLMARQGEGVRPDVMAGRLGDGKTAADMWAQVHRELQAVVNGADSGPARQDPNRDWTAAEIAANEARGTESPAEDKRDAAFDSANTADNGEGFHVEDFTPDMVGQTITVDGESMRIAEVLMNSLGTEAETVVLDDHTRFGRQVLENGEVVYIDNGADETALNSSPSMADRVDAAAGLTDTEPTDGQKEAGNYPKGKVSMHGLTVSIENPRGSTRSGTDRGGKPWSIEMPHHYGYFLGTEARDGDHVDTFVGPNPESTKVWIVNQIDPTARRFDEHKVMLGFNSRQDAIKGYQASYSPGWKGLGDIVETDVAGLKNWLGNGDTKKRATQAALALPPAPETLNSSPSPSDSGRSAPVDLPPAVIGHDLGAMSSHPDYTAAKAGNREAGLRLAKDLVTPDLVAKVRQLAGNQKPVIVPVLAIEQTGNNMIPVTAAEVLAHRMGLETSTEVVQAVRANRTAKSGLDRVFSQPVFDGAVEPGKAYLLLDDTLTQGGTFAALADHIRRGGGKVLGAVALTGKQYSATLRLSEGLLGQLRSKFGEVESDFRRATGHGFDRLTESEARSLLSWRPADAVRNRIVAEGHDGGLGLGEAGAGEGTLKSSPSPESSAAVDQALAKMPPIYRQVFDSVNSGSTVEDVMRKHSISAKAVENILNSVRSRLTSATAAAGPAGLSPVMRGDKFLDGRPDLALSTNPQVAAIDQIRNESGVPGTRSWDEVQAAADKLLGADYQGTYDRLLEHSRNQVQLSDVDVAAAKSIIGRETMAGMIQSADDRVKLAMLIHGYRDVGTETARALAMRRDPSEKPAQRHARFIAEALFTPDAETRRRLKKAGKGQQEAILDGWMRRVDSIKADLLAQGIDLDASLTAFREREESRTQAEKESPRAKAVIEEKIRKLNKREKAVIEAIRSGSLVSHAAFLTGMTADEVKAVYSRFLTDIRGAMTASAKRFLEGTLASSPSGDLMGNILAELGFHSLDAIDDTQPGFVDRRNQKPRKPKPKAAPAPLSQPNISLDEWANRPPSAWRTLYETEMKGLRQDTKPTFEHWAAKEFPETTRAWTWEMNLLKPGDRMTLEEWAQKPASQWKTLFETEMRGLQPQSRVSFEEWAAKALPDQVRQWQSEMDLLPKEDRLSFEEWANKPLSADRFAPEQDMFPSPVQPINETTGTFDLHDELAMKQVIDAFAAARGSKMDALMEYWRMSVLSGPQTHIVNTGSNLLHAAYNLLPRRAVEAGANNVLSALGMGSKDAATFGEFSVMARHVRQAVTTAARNALRSWQLESRVFDSFASAERLQLDFTGVGGERFEPAVKGKFGKLMRSISFRAMTAADEFMKAFYGQLEAAGHAHRIARVEEKLTGDAYEARIKDLVQPGSAAWVRAIDETKRVTFQEEFDGENPRLIHRIDQLAQVAKNARAMPWIGRPLTFFLPFIDTPTNIAKQAIEMSPLGLFLSVADGIHALKAKFLRGKLTKAEADLEASKLYDRARLVHDVTNQTIAWATFFAIGQLAAGGDDKDLPFITGTQPYKSTKRGERDNAYAVMPPQSIRIGNSTFSYARIDPFATALASMVDFHTELNRQGGFKPEVFSQWLSRFKDSAKDKTFLQGVSNLINAIEDPDRFAERLTSGIVTGFVPNIVRQPLRETDPYMRDTSPRKDEGFFTSVGKSVGYSLAPQAAPVKADVWGNPVPRHRGEPLGGSKFTDMALRIFDPTNAAVNPTVDPLDRWIYRWNLQTADSKDRIGIQPLPGYLTATVPGEKKPRTIALTVDEQREASVSAGKMARTVLGDGWEDAPLTPENRDRIVKTYKQAQKVERAKLRMEKLAGSVAGPEEE